MVLLAWQEHTKWRRVWGKQVKSSLLMMENSIVKTKLSNFTSKYLPNQSTFYLVNGKNVDFL